MATWIFWAAKHRSCVPFGLFSIAEQAHKFLGGERDFQIFPKMLQEGTISVGFVILLQNTPSKVQNVTHDS